jgi:hypothetical protein
LPLIVLILILSVSKYHQEGFGSTTTPELDNYNKQKKDLEDVNNKMNKMINKMTCFIKENDELFNTFQNVSINYNYNQLLLKLNRKRIQKVI